MTRRLLLLLLIASLTAACGEDTRSVSLDYVDFDRVETIGEEPESYVMVGEPIWLIDDLQLIRSKTTNPNAPSEGVACLFGQERQTYNPEAFLFYPERGLEAPYRTDFSAHVGEPCDVRSGLELPSELDAEPSEDLSQLDLSLIWTLLPRPGLAAFGESIYFTRGPILPASIFPITATVEILYDVPGCQEGLPSFQETPCRRSVTLSVPSNDNLTTQNGQPISGDGYAHLPMFAGGLALLRRDGDGLGVPPGSYPITLSIRDASGSGYDLSLTAQALCEDGSTTCICEDARANCNGLTEDGCEIDITSDALNCGGCALACDEAEVCIQGTCVESNATEPQTVLTLGDAHTCLLHDLEVYCWGSNVRGQLGVELETPDIRSAEALRVLLPDGMRDLDAGAQHTCAIAASDHRLWCWGDNVSNQVHEVPEPSRSTPIVPAHIDGVAIDDVALGRSHTCALTREQRVVCWGANDRCQLGPCDATGVTELDLSPVPEPPEALVAGDNHTCLIAGDSIYCWGDNRDRQLLSDDPMAGSLYLHQYTIDNTLGPLSADAGGDRTCVYFQRSNVEKMVICNHPGQDAPGALILPVSELSVRVGQHQCYVIDDPSQGGLLWQCLGNNTHLQLTSTDQALSDGPLHIYATGQIEDVLLMGVGYGHTCQLLSDPDDPTMGVVRCWGLNHQGQAGVAPPAPPTASEAVRSLEGVWDEEPWLAVGGDMTCVAPRTQEEGALCWGGAPIQHEDGHLNRYWGYPGSVVPRGLHPGWSQGIVAEGAAISAQATCMADAAGALACWGESVVGQQLTGPLLYRNAVSHIALPKGSVCAARAENNNVACFGEVVSRDVFVPQEVTLSARPTQLIASEETALVCALTEPNELWCWGLDAIGALGEDITVSPETPVSVATDVHDATFSPERGLCIVSRAEPDRVTCLGEQGQASITAPSPIADIEAGAFGFCMILAEGGAVHCPDAQGWAPTGEDGAVLSEEGLPITGARALGVSSEHACALIETGPGHEVWCWGSDDAGQLGTGRQNVADPLTVSSLPPLSLSEPVDPTPTPIDGLPVLTCETPIPEGPSFPDGYAVIGVFGDPDCNVDSLVEKVAYPLNGSNGCCTSSTSVLEASECLGGEFALVMTEGSCEEPTSNNPQELLIPPEICFALPGDIFVVLLSGCDGGPPEPGAIPLEELVGEYRVEPDDGNGNIFITIENADDRFLRWTRGDQFWFGVYDGDTSIFLPPDSPYGESTVNVVYDPFNSGNITLEFVDVDLVLFKL